MKKTVSFDSDDANVLYDPVAGHFPSTVDEKAEIWYTKQEINWFRQNLIQTVQMEEMVLKMEEQEEAMSIASMVRHGGTGNRRGSLSDALTGGGSIFDKAKTRAPSDDIAQNVLPGAPKLLKSKTKSGADDLEAGDDSDDSDDDDNKPPKKKHWLDDSSSDSDSSDEGIFNRKNKPKKTKKPPKETKPQMLRGDSQRLAGEWLSRASEMRKGWEVDDSENGDGSENGGNASAPEPVTVSTPRSSIRSSSSNNNDKGINHKREKLKRSDSDDEEDPAPVKSSGINKRREKLKEVDENAATQQTAGKRTKASLLKQGWSGDDDGDSSDNDSDDDDSDTRRKKLAAQQHYSDSESSTTSSSSDDDSDNDNRATRSPLKPPAVPKTSDHVRVEDLRAKAKLTMIESNHKKKSGSDDSDSESSGDSFGQEEKARKPPKKAPKAPPPPKATTTSNLTPVQIQRKRDLAMKFYIHFSKPTRKDLKRLLKKLLQQNGKATGLEESDLDLLPWDDTGTRLVSDTKKTKTAPTPPPPSAKKSASPALKASSAKRSKSDQGLLRKSSSTKSPSVLGRKSKDSSKSSSKKKSKESKKASKAEKKQQSTPQTQQRKQKKVVNSSSSSSSSSSSEDEAPPPPRKPQRAKSAPLKGINGSTGRSRAPSLSKPSKYVDTLPADDKIGRTKRAYNFYCDNGRTNRTSLLTSLQLRYQTCSPEDNLPSVSDINEMLPWNFNGTVVNEFKLMKIISMIK